MTETIQVFEQESLRVGDLRQGVRFTEAHWQALLHRYDKPGLPVFKVIHRGIRWGSLAGVLSVPDLTIEILPKVEAVSTLPGLWRNVLLDMLLACEKITPYAVPSSRLQVQQGTLPTLWLRQFLKVVEVLLGQGLSRQYQRQEGNTTTLRGQILFAENIRRNGVHQERFYTRHQTYDMAHRLHSILYAALQQAARSAPHPQWRQQARQLSACFPVCDTPLPPDALKNITYHRQTVRYRPAVELARLLLAGQSPVLKAGDDWSGPTFLIDMNRLYEEYVYRQLARAARQQNLRLEHQVSTHFWANRSLRPDMVLTLPDGSKIVLDTKWKLPKNGQPADEDLKQIYIYNQHFGAQRGVLLYPQVAAQPSFREAYHLHVKQKLYCEVQFVRLLDEPRQRLNPYVGEEILAGLDLI